MLTIFLAIFVAELGDKTQLATMVFASDKQINPFWVFVSAAGALALSAAIAVTAGFYAAKFIETMPLKLISGAIFIVIGSWYIYEHFTKTAL